MNDSDDHLEKVFGSPEWRPVALSEKARGSGLTYSFESNYAIVSVMLAPSVELVLSCWPDCQVAVADLRQNTTERSKKDMYLVFVVPRIPNELIRDLQGVVSDTRVCRKMCLEQGERQLEEVFMDTPFVRLAKESGENSGASAGSALTAPSGPLSDEILDDLKRRSAEAILSKLLAEGYGPVVKTHET
jgi:hypothetical protein